MISAAICVLASLITTIPATHPNVRTIGRFDYRDVAGPRCSWPASAIEIRFQGRSLTAKIREEGNDFLQVEVDGKATQVLALKQGDGNYTIPMRQPGNHIVRFVKRTEPFVGTTQYLSFEIPGGKILPAAAPNRRLEIVGDSISCGYGNEGTSQSERYKNETENAYLAYGPIAARRLKADWSVIAWSGRKMWPDNTVPEIYDLILPGDPSSKWEFKSQPPDAIVINLATNDFGAGNPDESQWTAAYETFIHRLRKHYPKAFVYCAVGTMMNDGWPKGSRALTTVRGYLGRMVSRLEQQGVRKIKVLDFGEQQQEDGIGSDWHPSVRTHHRMADRLVSRLQKDLGWR